jgi:hypothetical protein
MTCFLQDAFYLEPITCWDTLSIKSAFRPAVGRRWCRRYCFRMSFVLLLTPPFSTSTFQFMFVATSASETAGAAGAVRLRPTAAASGSAREPPRTCMHAQRFIASSAAKALIILYERTLVTAASPIAPNIFRHPGSVAAIPCLKILQQQ